MPFKQTQAELLKLSDRHASELRTHLARANEGATALYQHVAGMEGEKRFSTLRKELATLVGRARDDARQLAVAHVLSELRAAIGSKADRVSLDIPADAKPADVAEYITNAVTAAREAEDIASTAYRAHTIIESEGTSSYQAGRDIALHHLRSIPDSQAVKLGFKVARSQSEFRDVDEAELVTRADDGEWIPLIGSRWNSRGDSCDKCRGVDGELRPLGIGFSLGGPGAHARCQCVTSLWVLPVWIPEEKGRAVNEQLELLHKADGGLCWIDNKLEARALEIDEATRTVRNAVASDESEDSHGSVIRVDGWDLSRHRRNPVLLWAHRSDEPRFVIGTARVRPDGKRLIADLTFSPKGVNPEADLVFEQVKAEIVRGLSVGFRPVEYSFEPRKTGEDLLVFTKQELVELTVCAVPSNKNSLTKQLRALGMPAETGRSADLPTIPEAITAATSPAFQKDNIMSDNAKPVVALPPEIAARLSAETVEQALGELAKRELQLDKITSERDALKGQVDALKADIEKRNNADAEAEVNALIKRGALQEAKRQSALTLYKADRASFRDLYPLAEAPMEHLFTQVTTPEPPDARANVEPAPQADNGINPVWARAQKLMGENPGMSIERAIVIADKEFSKVPFAG